MALIWAALVILITCALITGAIASGKGLSFGGYFIVGLLLGVIGLVIAICAQPAERYKPGWYSDPLKAATWRWFDGRAWTETTA